jgi:hypothetical protein
VVTQGLELLFGEVQLILEREVSQDFNRVVDALGFDHEVSQHARHAIRLDSELCGKRFSLCIAVQPISVMSCNTMSVYPGSIDFPGVVTTWVGVVESGDG